MHIFSVISLSHMSRFWVLALLLNVFLVQAQTDDGTTVSLATDGGPWAPVLYDVSTLSVTPQQLAPGEDLTVSLAFRPEHAPQVSGLQIRFVPKLLERDVTGSLDRETGLFSATLPGKLLRLNGEYEIRLDIAFEWTDGKAYRRSPRLGSITIVPFGDYTYTAKTLSEDLSKLETAVAEARSALLQRVETVPDGLLPNLTVFSATCRDRVARGEYRRVKTGIDKATDVAIKAGADPGGVLYRYAIAQWISRSRSMDDGPIMSILTGHTLGYTEADYAGFRELGIGIVSARRPSDVAVLREHGFGSVISRAPVRFTKGYLPKHPEHRQHRYLISDPQQAENTTIDINPLLGFHEDHYDVDPAGDAGKYWRVVDLTEDAVVDPARWHYDAASRRVGLASAVPGHDYCVVVLVQGADVPFFDRCGEPMEPRCLNHILQRLDLMLQEYDGVTVYRPTSLFYPFPKIDRLIDVGEGKRQKRSWHNFYGNQWGTSPAVQELFTKEAGIPFDPLWMVDGGRYGDINYPPPPEYAAWRAFQAGQVNRMAHQVVDVAHKRGATVRVFWGDHWAGMEPYGRFFAETGTDQIVKACKSATVVRMTVDIPADVKKIIRFSPWFSEGELFKMPHPAGFMERCWGNIKRGALFHVPDGFSWGGDTQTIGFKQPVIYGKMTEISQEFRVIHSLLAGRQPFTHDLNLYVVNAWGQLRPWCGWLQVNESQQVLEHLTDLPVNVRFLSLTEIAEHGIPGDADVILNAGEPHSAWSGGAYWTDAVTQAVEEFVSKGGGVIGIGAPSHQRTEGGFWRLRSVLGVDFLDSIRRGEGDSGSFSTYDATFLRRGPKPSAMLPMQRTATDHFITEDLSETTAPVLTNVVAKPVADDLSVLCSGDGKGFEAPVVTARAHRAGRAVYINGYSSADDYGWLIRRAIFWAARKEGAFEKLVADEPCVKTYLYPSEKLLIVYNLARKPVTTNVTFDVALLGLAQDRVQMTDVLTGRSRSMDAGVCRETGMLFELSGHEVAFLRVE